MSEELEKATKYLEDIDEKIDSVSKQWTRLKHEYRSNRDSEIRVEIKKKWDELQAEMELLEKTRRQALEKKNDIEFKSRWKGWKKQQ